jgi:hypothetical protein
MKVRGGEYDSPGPEQQSEAFFAGIKVFCWPSFSSDFNFEYRVAWTKNKLSKLFNKYK